ncbi:hypothetical protein C8Q76DRAFT_472148 [Earliella scabrosa]|nr:hypothetical protein C8Q76DRAFT_472148 [Earliella scabrosa]
MNECVLIGIGVAVSAVIIAVPIIWTAVRMVWHLRRRSPHHPGEVQASSSTRYSVLLDEDASPQDDEPPCIEKVHPAAHAPQTPHASYPFRHHLCHRHRIFAYRTDNPASLSCPARRTVDRGGGHSVQSASPTEEAADRGTVRASRSDVSVMSEAVPQYEEVGSTVARRCARKRETCRSRTVRDVTPWIFTALHTTQSKLGHESLYTHGAFNVLMVENTVEVLWPTQTRP